VVFSAVSSQRAAALGTGAVHHGASAWTAARRSHSLSVGDAVLTLTVSRGRPQSACEPRNHLRHSSEAKRLKTFERQAPTGLHRVFVEVDARQRADRR